MVTVGAALGVIAIVLDVRTLRSSGVRRHRVQAVLGIVLSALAILGVVGYYTVSRD